MRKLIWLAVLVVAVIIGGRLLYYGFTSYTPPDRPLPEDNIEVAAVAARLEAVDNPQVSRGVVAVDYAHDNALFIEELNVLFSRIVSRGYSYEVLLNPDDAEEAGLEAKTLADTLRYAKALILPLPRVEYTPEEAALIEQFVNKGGRLLIIGDPTRTIAVEALNSIAETFGIIYPNDYLYSLEHNDNNYRNVVYTRFAKSPLTEGLDEDARLIFYSGSSVSAPGHEIIFGDETTYSSVSEGGRTLAAAALTTNDQVLALGDLTFFTEPYSAAENNGVFINNIADFLTAGERQYDLEDFPYFLNPQVDLVFDDALVFNSQFDSSVQLKEALEQLNFDVRFTDQIESDRDVIYVGRFDNPETVQEYLDDAGIAIFGPDETPEDGDQPDESTEEPELTPVSDIPPEDVEERFIDGRIHVEGMGDVERGGTTLFYRLREGGRNILIILSDTAESNADAFELLLNNELSLCTASPDIALCQTQEPGGKLPPSLRSPRVDTILVVSDDDGRARFDAQTSALDYQNVLSDTYQVDVWVTSEQESPDIDELLQYDAVIWTTGDFWDDSIGEEDAALLSEYVRLGGNLILSGASIGFDWDHTDFLKDVAHADYLDFAEQRDLELVLPDHPLAKGFDEGAVITLEETPSGEPLDIDVVRHTPDARVVFQRGPDSDQAGAASVIVYEDERVKIAYYAFPLYLLPPETQDLLVNNTVLWFARKPLAPPDEAEYQPYENGEENGSQPPNGEEPPPEEPSNGEEK